MEKEHLEFNVHRCPDCGIPHPDKIDDIPRTVEEITEAVKFIRLLRAVADKHDIPQKNIFDFYSKFILSYYPVN